MAFPKRKALWWSLAAGAGVIVALFATAAIVLRGDVLRPRFISALAEALNCDVSLDRLDVQIVPVIKITGNGLTVRLRGGRPELPPYIAATRFTVGLGLLSMLRRHVDTVHLEGLQLNVPARRGNDTAPATALVLGRPPTAHGRPLFSVDHVVAHEATLNFVAQADRVRPLNLVIHDLDILNASIDRAMRFTASVTNPLPLGLVDTGGTFGPWNRDDPAATPVSGTYTMADGDLGAISGVSGRVKSAGAFTGRLTELHVEGTSSTPDLSLDLGGNPAAFTTEFAVIIDGTIGAIALNRVDAVLVSTPMRITGAIVNRPGPGRDAELTVDVKDGRIEDLLRLAINSDRPILTGDVALLATLRLPSGPGTMRQRLKASGRFGLGDAQFNDVEVQRKLQELSRRGQGRNQDDIVSRIATSVNGTFSLTGGVLSVPRVAFAVPGATISLAGSYTIGSEELDFTGTARLQASLSRVVGGFKSVFIKPFNRLFSTAGAGSVIPITITGTRSQPHFAVVKGRIFKKGK